MGSTPYFVCALDCPDTCSLVLTVEDGRATGLRGDPGHPVTRGFLYGAVRSASVRWAKRAEDGRNVNALTSDRLTDVGGGTVFYNCLVQEEKCGD